MSPELSANFGACCENVRGATRAHGRGPAAARARRSDELRQHLLGGAAVITPGIAVLGPAFVARLVETIAVFDDFCHANDPHAEHDFGSFDVEGYSIFVYSIFFKIDYFDKTMTYHSPDPADPRVTERVMTIMLAEEY